MLALFSCIPHSISFLYLSYFTNTNPYYAI